MVMGGTVRLLDERIDQRILKPARDVRALDLDVRALRGIEHRGLEPGKGDVVVVRLPDTLIAPEHRTGKSMPRRITVFRDSLDVRPARVGKPEQLRHLVERLARRVI